jgi:DNA-binding transcriptional LysR family regulator
VEAELATGVLRALPIAGWTLMRPVSMVYRSQKYFSPVGERFRDFAKSYGAQHLERAITPRAVRRAQPRG